MHTLLFLVLFFFTDIDECALSDACDPQGTHACVNLNGTYTCTCKDGFQGIKCHISKFFHFVEYRPTAQQHMAYQTKGNPTVFNGIILKLHCS